MHTSRTERTKASDYGWGATKGRFSPLEEVCSLTWLAKKQAKTRICEGGDGRDGRYCREVTVWGTATQTSYRPPRAEQSGVAEVAHRVAEAAAHPHRGPGKAKARALHRQRTRRQTGAVGRGSACGRRKANEAGLSGGVKLPPWGLEGGGGGARLLPGRR